MVRRALLFGTLFLLALTANAFAGDGKDCGWTASGEKVHEDWKSDKMSAYNVHMGDIDGNGDDALSWDEFQAHFTNTERSVFDAIDGDGDASLSHDEWHAFKEAHGMAGHGGKAGQGGMAHGEKGRYHRTALPDPAGFMAKMDALDADGDGSVTWEEFTGQFPDAGREVYDAMDLDGNGTVGAEEWQKFREAHGKG